MTPRQRALALLDVLGVGTERDQVRKHVERVAMLRRCFRGEHPACTLVDALEGLEPDVVDSVGKDCRYPLDVLAWVFADASTDPIAREGQFDPRNLVGRTPTAFGELNRWWSRSETRLREAIARATADGDDERADHLRQTLAHNARPRSTLVLASDTGVGKSVALVWFCVHHGGTFMRAAEFGEIALGQKAAIERLVRIPLLGIDELGRESDVRPTPARVTEVLGLRHDQGRPTIITTQITSTKDFDDRYGHHLRDRIVNGGGSFAVLRGDTRRQPKVHPSLHAIRVSARVADLVAAVDASTGRGSSPNERAIAKLQRLMGVVDADLERAWSERSSWQSDAMRGANELSDLARGIVQRFVEERA